MKRLIAFCLCATLILCCTACGTTNPQTPKYTKYSAYAFDYFDTAAVITGYAESQGRIPSAV